MPDDDPRFCRNCDSCGSNYAWRDKRQGLLKPLPVPKRIRSNLSVDFIETLPHSEGHSYLMVKTNRLSRGVILTPLISTDGKHDALVFARFYDFFRLHGSPQTMTSDEGNSFVSLFWAWICRFLGISKHLSTVHHPRAT